MKYRNKKSLKIKIKSVMNRFNQQSEPDEQRINEFEGKFGKTFQNVTRRQ